MEMSHFRVPFQGSPWRLTWEAHLARPYKSQLPDMGVGEAAQDRGGPPGRLAAPHQPPKVPLVLGFLGWSPFAASSCGGSKSQVWGLVPGRSRRKHWVTWTFAGGTREAEATSPSCWQSPATWAATLSGRTGFTAARRPAGYAQGPRPGSPQARETRMSRPRGAA